MKLNVTGMTVQQMLKDASDSYGDFLCVKCKKSNKIIQFTYREYECAMPFSMHLIGKQRIRGARIAILTKDRELLLRWMFSVMYCGGVAVPLNPDLDVTTLKQIIENVEPEAIAIDNEMINSWKGVLSEDLLECMISVEEADSELSYDNVPDPVKSDSPAIIVYTSGTTGKPKGVVINNENFLGNNVPASLSWLKVTKKPLHAFSVMPFYHVMAIAVDVLMPFMTGGSVTIENDKNNLLKGLLESKCNLFVCVPMILNYILVMLKSKAGEDNTLSKETIKNSVLGNNLEVIACAGAKMKPDVRDEIESFGVYVVTAYGMTEMTAQISSDVFTLYGKRKRESIGMLNPALEWKNTEEGELLVKGPGVMDGYWKMPEETEKALKDGWVYTGDLITVDEEGYLFFKGRCKNVIVMSDGENVSPEIVENNLSDNLPGTEIRVSEGKGGLHADIGLKGIAVPDDLETILRDYNQDRQMSWQIRSYSLYENGLEKNQSGKIIRNKSNMQNNERKYI